jgi:hypothetical protein
MGNTYARRVAAQGIPVVFVMQTDEYMGKIKCRMPSIKITAV